ncbi:hypothetical protein RSK20926_01077 [Roseobacter sp. SK209-2-6]|uniref:acyl carrier protein n=1 Tax=Roseobacter sp. SK209-2-6 TaxID=388739 RepID=UPI0000F3F1ED|nr:acyl carrier protein [Roseobacter sp. SK209-2-6]EBA14544.1 hypothetical protein RSK20926_01077 [Roseobacter sp. SK209-2-6]
MSEYQTWLAEWFSAQAPDVSLAPQDNFFDIGAIDSFGVIELIEAAEDAFDIRFSNDDFQDRRFSSIAGLAEILSEKKSDAVSV